MEQNLQNLQLPVSIWKIIPTCYHRNKGEVEYISYIYSTSPLFLWQQVGIIFHILTGSCRFCRFCSIYQNLQNLQLPVSIWKIIPTCYHRNKGEVEYISYIYSTSPLFLWQQVGIIFHILTGSCRFCRFCSIYHRKL